MEVNVSCSHSIRMEMNGNIFGPTNHHVNKINCLNLKHILNFVNTTFHLIFLHACVVKRK